MAGPRTRSAQTDATASSPAPPAVPAVPAVVLLRGDDPVLRDQAVRAAVAQALEGDDPSFCLTELTADNDEAGAIVDAAATLPMFGSRRVVLAREIGKYSAEQVEPLVAWMADPSPTSRLVLVGGGGQIPKKLLDAVKKCGSVVDTGVPSGKARQQWLAERLVDAPVRLDARATAHLGDHLGDDVGRLDSVLAVLTAVYGEGARVSVDDIEPFLGQAGSGAPWDLTDAIDRGDVAASLIQLGRQMEGGERHPLQILGSLHAHFGRMLRLDGAGARDEQEAARALGMTGSTFPARKALSQCRKLGSANVARAIGLLAQADLDLKGKRDIPGEQIMEILVARLARLGASAGAASTTRRPSR